MYVSQPDINSHRSQIEALSTGESFARAHRFDGDDAGKDKVAAALRTMRLSLQPTAFRITKRTGYEYTIEAGEFRTLSRDVVIVVVVTRTA